MKAQEIKELRARLELSQTAFGEKLGITRDAVAKLESGENNMSRPVEILATQLLKTLL
jgi:DNA-binding transcriptional regulator YiaG